MNLTPTGMELNLQDVRLVAICSWKSYLNWLDHTIWDGNPKPENSFLLAVFLTYSTDAILRNCKQLAISLQIRTCSLLYWKTLTDLFVFRKKLPQILFLIRQCIHYTCLSQIILRHQRNRLFLYLEMFQFSVVEPQNK